MANETFYPPITNLLALDDLPDELGFVKDGVTDLLDKILYKDLQYTRTRFGDTAFYNLSIVSKKRIEVELPGTGIFLILNPSHDASTLVSEFPISLNYSWPIIAYVGSLDLSNFSFSPSGFFDLALRVFRLSEKTLIERALAIFLSNAGSPLSDFVSKLNSSYGTNIPVPSGNDPIGDLLTSMKKEPGIGPVGPAVFALYILDKLDVSKSKENINQFFSGLVEPDFETFMLDLLKPKVDASLTLGAGLEFPRDVLLPVDDAGEPIDGQEKVMLIFSPAEFYFSTERGIGYEAELGVTLNHKAQIGQTGLGIELTNAKLDISRTTNIAEADQDGRPKDFVGAYIQQAVVSLPNFLNHNDVGSTAIIVGKNLIIGTGGFSGTVGLEAKNAGDPAPLVKASLGGGFEISLDNFFVSFRQNSILGCSITGMLKIPGFKDSGGNDAEIKIKVDITDGGNYSITLSEDQGIGPFEIPGILKFSVLSLSLGEKNDKFFVAISGKIDFIVNIPAVGNILPKGIEIKKLMIWEDGSLEFEGGTVTLPKAVTLQAGPVNFSVTAIHFGTHKQFFSGQERTYSYFGFDGGISVKPGGVDARGDGIKFYYTSDNLAPFDCFLRIDGIGINLTIPGDATPETAAVIFKGYLAMKNADGKGDATTEYVGAVSLALPKLNIAGSAAMRLNPDIPAFLVDVGLELSVPIMLGATGLGIYGFRGLIGQKYMPSKAAAEIDESETWWYYYKSKKPDPPAKEGIHFGKFQQKNGFSLGAGVSLATAPDVGKTFSSKIFFMLSLPEVFLLQGQAAILKDRIGLDDTVDPPFSLLIAISGESVEAAIGVNYKIPDSGNMAGAILTLQATIEMAFFFHNSNGWYINLGRDTPEEKRVQAKILTLFNGYAFLMLSASGIKAGAGSSWKFKKSYGPVSIDVGTYLDMGGQLSFKPVQIGGFVQIGGYAHASVFGFVLGFDISAGLAAECPKPFIVTGFFKLKFKLKVFWFLTVSFNINVELTWEIDPEVNDDPLPVIGSPTANYRPAIASNIMSRDVFAVGHHTAGTNTIPAPNAFPGGLPVIPMDSYIDVELLQAIKPGPDTSLDRIGYSRSGIAESYKIVVPPEKGKSEQVNHEFTVESIRVLHWDGVAWVEYFVYEAVSAINSIASLPGVTVKDQSGADLQVSNIKELCQGYWQLQKPNRYDKLRLLSQNMFSYHTDGTPGGISIEGQQFSDEDVFCQPTLKDICINWKADEYTGDIYAQDTYHSFNGVSFKSGHMLEVKKVPNPHGFPQGLQFVQNLDIHFSKSVSKVNLRLITDGSLITIHYCWYYWEIDGNGNLSYQYDILSSKVVSSLALGQPVFYDDINKPINKIIVEGGSSAGLLNNAPLHMGASTGKFIYFFEGELDELRLFNRDLTNEDIGKLHAGNQVLPGMVAGWSLDQTANDETGTHNGQIKGNLNWSAGVFDQAALFQNSAYIAVPHDPELSFGETSFSISVWVKPAQAERSRNMTVVEKMNTTDAGTFGYGLSFTEGRLVFDLAFGTLERYDSGWTLRPDWQHIVIVVDRNNRLIKIYVNMEMIRKVELKEPPPNTYPTTLFELCYTNYDKAFEYQNQIGDINVTVEVQNMENGLTKRFQPIWRPNTKFVVQIEAKDKVTHGGATLSDSSVFHNFAFQTSSTLGHFHKNHPGYTALLTQGKEEEYKLSKLQHYIDYDKSYPNADGKLVNAKPLFYQEVELLLFFRYAYIYSMFSNWDAYHGLGTVESALEVIIIDSEGKEIKQEPVWNFESLKGGLPEDIIKINKFIENGKNCTGTQVIEPFGVQMQYKMPDLQPEKLYSTVFRSVFKEPASGKQKSEVHKYVFQTSRYGSFGEQVKSYFSVAPGALFDCIVDTNNADVAQAVTVLNNTISNTDPLVATYADTFDRLMQGALKLPALDVAVCTEFNVLKRKDNGNILGILIRNPEPFNDPKLPAAQKQLTVAAKDAGANMLMSLVAKEPSKIFVSNAGMKLGAGNFEFKFTYYLFDGSDFAVKDQQTVNLTIS